MNIEKYYEKIREEINIVQSDIDKTRAKRGKLSESTYDFVVGSLEGIKIGLNKALDIAVELQTAEVMETK